MPAKQKIILSVINDLSNDQRIHKVSSSLQKHGFEVLLVGRQLEGSPKVQRAYSTKRFRLWFTKGPLFYANYNLRLFIFLLFSKADVLVANDLDTLLANYLVAKLKGKKLVYDSHELFTQVPELIGRPKVQAVWKKLEAWMLPNIKYAYTVSEGLANYYQLKYRIDMKLIRNFPFKKEPSIQAKENVLIYQGALNVGRGLEELIAAMQFVEGHQLLIAGGGDIEQKLIQLVDELKLNGKVKFLGRLPLEDLQQYTTRAKLGFSIEKKHGLNYKLALPNKVFDYIHASVPVLYSDLQEVKNTLKEYEVGEELKSYEAKAMAEQIQQMLNSLDYSRWLMNCQQAAGVFCWEREEKKLIELYRQLD
jgi:glycosyltransferase involved in cell wall biosynthesis